MWLGIPARRGWCSQVCRLSLGWVQLQQLDATSVLTPQVLGSWGRGPVVFVPFLQLQMWLLRRGLTLLLGDQGGGRLVVSPWAGVLVR